MREKFLNIIADESSRIILWLPVIFGFGIACYFSLKNEPDLYKFLILFIIICVCVFFLRKNPLYKWPLIITAIFLSGFLIAGFKTHSLKSYKLEEKTGVIKIKGTVLEIHQMQHGVRIIIGNLYSKKLEPDKTPDKVRINVRTKYPDDLTAGDKIAVLAILSPPPPPVFPGAYSFTEYAFFNQIGAVGYSLSTVWVDKKSESFFEKSISKLRLTITNKILNSTGEKEANIATALVVGEKGGIDKKTMDDIRRSGLAHLLAISGLHLALVASIFFFTSRSLLALSQSITLKYNIKKISAVITIIGSLFYLGISGAPVSAQRAFIMTSLIFIGVLIDRVGLSLRSISFAALAVLILFPESILTPSFQMSFAATLALISGYEYLRPFYKKIAEYGVSVKFAIYFFSLMLTSIIASLATAPYSIFHFHQVATLGIVANMIAVPVASIWVMPWLVAALFLMPFGAEKLALIPASWGIDLILKSAEFVASFKNTYQLVPQIPLIAMACLTFGGLWLLLWQTKFRLFGVLIIFIGIIFSFSYKQPDVIIDGSGKLYAVRGNDDILYFSSLVSARYSRKSWQEINGQELAPKIKNAKDKGFTCDKESCEIEKNGNSLKIFNKYSEVDCAYQGIIIDLGSLDKQCSSEDYFSQSDLRTNGTHVFYLKSKTFSNVKGQMGNRIWQ